MNVKALELSLTRAMEAKRAICAAQDAAIDIDDACIREAVERLLWRGRSAMEELDRRVREPLENGEF